MDQGIGGLEAVLHDQRQAQRRAALSGEQVAHLVAISCSAAPLSHDHWTLRLLAGNAVELGYVRAISPETIRRMRKKTMLAIFPCEVAAPPAVQPG